MKGLIIKDFKSLKALLPNLFFTTLLYMAIGFFSGENYIITLGLMITIFFALISSSIMSYDNLYQWDRYVLFLPLDKKTIVLSKYITALLCSVIGILFSSFYFIIFILLNKISLNLELLISLSSVFAISLLFSAVLLPFIYKYGVEKSRFILMAFGFGIFASFSFLTSFVEINNLEVIIEKIMLFLPLISIFAFILSYYASCKVYLKKTVH